ncbi:MAG: MutS-like ATPase involved in mismatch repair, family 2, partial [Bacillota bacterium]
MIEQYLAIKNNYQDALLFYRLGDFYEMFFEDAKLASQELDLTLTARGQGANRVPMCGVPHHAAYPYISRLINKGYKVALCEQTEDPSKTKGLVKRAVTRVITPGTVLDEDLLAGQYNNFLVALYGVPTEPIGFAAVDFSTGEIFVTAPANDTELLKELSIYTPREIIVLESSLKFIQGKLKSDQYLITPLDNSYQTSNQAAAAYPNYATKTAINLLYNYLKETQHCSLKHIKPSKYYHTQSYMMLDSNAQRNLDIFNSQHKTQGSLFEHLKHTYTAMGTRLLKQWLHKPLLNKQELASRQTGVQNFSDSPVFLHQLQNSLKEANDLERLTVRVVLNRAQAIDLKKIEQSLAISYSIKKELLAKMKSISLENLAHKISDATIDVMKLIKTAITDKPLAGNSNIIRPGYNDQLDNYKSSAKQAKAWLAALELDERKKTGIKSLKVGYNRMFGYYLEVSKSNLKYVPAHYQRKQTLANAERFVTNELKMQEAAILNAEAQAKALEEQIFTEVLSKIANYIKPLQQTSAALAEIDVLQSLATIALRYNYTRPVIHHEAHLKIEKGRHPIMETLLKEKFVANNLELTNEKQILLITGPNMAGKSTYMRQLALIIIMAQIGSFVPAGYAELPLVDRIFTRIGAADDLLGGQSTFMVEMTETKEALEQATNRSLLLLDEIGRGTSTYDGLALAQAIIEHIHTKLKAKTLFSTHYHELIKLEKQLPRVCNLHAKCIEKEGKIYFLHRILPGGAEKSYGL